MRRILVFFAVFIIYTQHSEGQSFFNNQHNRRFMATAGAGISTYLGDLNAPGDFFDPGLTIGGGGVFMVNPQMGFRGEFIYYRIAGTDQEHLTTIDRNLSFKGNNLEISTVAVYNLLPQGSRFYQRQPVTPYVFAGTGITIFRPTAEYNGKTYGLRQFKTEGKAYSPVAIILPLGGGAKIRVNSEFNVLVEAGYRKTFTDYLDDVSNRYVDLSTFDGDPIAIALQDRAPEAGYEPRNAGSRRGNPEKKDSYLIYSIKMEYYIPPELFSLKKLKKRPPGTKPTKRYPSRKKFKLFGK